MGQLRVAVVGGGIGGLAAAVALHRTGAEVAVYEQVEQRGEIGAGITVQPNAVRALERLGVADRVRQLGAELTTSASYYADGTLAGEEASTGWGLHRADLLRALAEALPAGVVRGGRRCVDLTQDDRGATLRLEDGAEVTADAVVAADGIHSTLQRHVVEPAEPLFSGMMAYRGLVPAARLPQWREGHVKT